MNCKKCNKEYLRGSSLVNHEKWCDGIGTIHTKGKITLSLKGRNYTNIYGLEQGLIEKQKRRSKVLGKKWKMSDSGKKNISISRKKKCENINERIRLREIGRKGGFGKKGYTNGGTYYQSSIEKKCFEYLEENNIKFIPHKIIPNSSKISDIYLPHKKLWIEIDGIDRERRKKWLGKDYEYWLEKLKIYNEQNLKYKIVKNKNELVILL